MKDAFWRNKDTVDGRARCSATTVEARLREWSRGGRSRHEDGGARMGDGQAGGGHWSWGETPLIGRACWIQKFPMEIPHDRSFRTRQLLRKAGAVPAKFSTSRTYYCR